MGGFCVWDFLLGSLRVEVGFEWTGPGGGNKRRERWKMDIRILLLPLLLLSLRRLLLWCSGRGEKIVAAVKGGRIGG